MRTFLVALAGLAGFASVAAAQAPPAPSDSVPAGEAAAKAGIVECDRLVSFLEQTPAAGVTLAEARAWRESFDAVACHDHLRRLTGEGVPSEASGAPAKADPAATGALSAPSQSVTVADLKSLPVYDDRNEKVGEVDSVRMGVDGRTYIVIDHGGFLGLGEKQALLPVDRFAFQGDRLIVAGLSGNSVRALPDFEHSLAYKHMLDDETAQIPLAR
jgi:hypothetical protein